MNILFLSSWYPTKKNPNVGIFVKEHACAIKAAGNNIVVMAIIVNKSKMVFSNSITDVIDENGIRNIKVELNSRFKEMIYHLIPLQYLIVKRVYKKNISFSFTPEIIHSNVVFPSGIIGYWLSKDLKKPHVITEHWSRIKGFVSKPVLGRLAIKVYENARYILPVSQFLKKNINEIIPTLNPEKLHVVGNIIDSKTFFYKEKNKTPDQIKFCAVATWANKRIPDKIPELFIEALAQLQKNIKQTIILTMIGGGNKVQELEALCLKKGLKVNFKGFQSKIEIAEQLQQSDYFLHASTVETFGVVVAEALVCGTPVICSNVGALPELVNASNGILCENTIAEWVDGIRKAINKSFDNSEISNNIKQKYSLTEIGKEINVVYKEIIAHV